MGVDEKGKEQKDFKEENRDKGTEEEVDMAYYCKVCQCWHYPGTEIWYAHRIYASKKPRPRKRVKRKKKSFWDTW